jgi:hypothetical protein
LTIPAGVELARTKLTSVSPSTKVIASGYVLGLGAGRNPGCSTSEEIPF